MVTLELDRYCDSHIPIPCTINTGVFYVVMLIANVFLQNTPCTNGAWKYTKSLFNSFVSLFCLVIKHPCKSCNNSTSFTS